MKPHATSSSTGPSLLRHLHASRVLSALQSHGPLSRAELARRTGISGATVSRVIADLLGARLVEEGDRLAGLPGRPGKALRLANTAVSVLGIVVGARRCELFSAGLDGVIRPDSLRQLPTPPRYPDLVRTLVRQAGALMGESSAAVLGIGVSMPGLLHRREKRTLVSPNLHQTDGRRLGEDLRRHLGVDIEMLQESHALCAAEQNYGAARGLADFAMLDISEGLGLGVVQGGQLLQGHSGLAGELGHVTAVLDGRPCGCGNRGCLETVATDTALAVSVSERIGRRLTVDEVIEAVRAGQLRADAELSSILNYLAVAVGAVLNIFNPGKLFIHGRVLDADPKLFDDLLTRVRRHALTPSLADCEIVRARGNKQLGAVAAIMRRLC